MPDFEKNAVLFEGVVRAEEIRPVHPIWCQHPGRCLDGIRSSLQVTTTPADGGFGFSNGRAHFDSAMQALNGKHVKVTVEWNEAPSSPKATTPEAPKNE